MDPNPHFHLIASSEKVGDPAAGTVQLVRATPIEPVRAFTSMPS